MLKHYKATETRTQRFVGIMLAAADETFVVDPDAGTANAGALFRVDAVRAVINGCQLKEVHHATF